LKNNGQRATYNVRVSLLDHRQRRFDLALRVRISLSPGGGDAVAIGPSRRLHVASGLVDQSLLVVGVAITRIKLDDPLEEP
jgi:hypothetical protein